MMMIVMGIVFLSSVQPILMIFSLIIITLLYSLYLYMVMGSYWFGYVLIMILLSGVLVVFTYMVSLIPNESFEIYNLVFIGVFVYLFLMWSYLDCLDDFSCVSLCLWVLYVGVMNLFLVGFLLSIMLMVVWVGSASGSALRGE